MAAGSCPATNQRSWKDRSGAVAGSIFSQELPRQLIRRCNTSIASKKGHPLEHNKLTKTNKYQIVQPNGMPSRKKGRCPPGHPPEHPQTLLGPRHHPLLQDSFRPKTLRRRSLPEKWLRTPHHLLLQGQLPQTKRRPPQTSPIHAGTIPQCQHHHRHRRRPQLATQRTALHTGTTSPRR